MSNYVAEISQKTGVKQNEVEKIISEITSNESHMTRIAQKSYGFYLKPSNPPVRKIAGELRTMDNLLSVMIRHRLTGRVDNEMFDDIISKASEIVEEVTKCNSYLKGEVNKTKKQNKKKARQSNDDQRSNSGEKKESPTGAQEANRGKTSIVADPLGR